MKAKLIAKVRVDPLKCTEHVRAIQIVRLPHQPVQLWISRNPGKGSPYLVWLHSPTLINKRYWAIDVSGAIVPVMWIQVEDWPKEFPRLRPGQKLQVGLADYRFFEAQEVKVR